MAKEFPIRDIIDGQPVFDVPLPEMFKYAHKGGAVKFLNPTEYHTARQRRWYKGVCLRQLAKGDENAETIAWWDAEVKRLCNGLAYLRKEIWFNEYGVGTGRLTTVGVGKKNMTNFIEEILSQAVQRGWPISPINPDLRKKK